MPELQHRPAVLGVYVHRYKNLQDIVLPWASGTAIFGANGTGKTNLLEALAILFGAKEALQLAAPRLNDVNPGDLQLVAQVPPDELPWPPDLQHADAPSLDPHSLPGAVRAHLDSQWWKSIGASSGATFLDGIQDTGVPHSLLDYLRNQLNEPVMRYSLRRAEFVKFTSDDEDDPPTLTLSYERTLLGRTPPPAVQQSAHRLPDAFAPLRTALASHIAGTPDGMADLLTLPATDTVPFQLQWLPRTRTSTEVDEALIEAYTAAKTPSTALARELVELPVAVVPDDSTPHPDVDWWLHTIITKAANDHLDLTLPNHIVIEPEAAGPADLVLTDPRDNVQLGQSGDRDMLDRLSAGQRRWVDEALATATRTLTDFGQRAEIYRHVLDSLDEEQLLPELLAITDTVQNTINSDGYFSATAIQTIIDALEPALRTAAIKRLHDAPDPIRRSLIEHIYGLQALRPHTTIHVIDEPEAHLHPGAQRTIAAALETLRRQGRDIVLATHSPQFLDLPGWQLVHLQRTPDGSTLSPLHTADLDARRALAHQLGLTRGELLARLTALLIVEGEQDRLVLETLYGNQLDDAGIGIVRMHGTNNILATAELDFIGKYLDIPVAILTDHTRVDAVNSKLPDAELSDEEHALRSLRRACKKRGSVMHLYGLQRPDITAYLNSDAIKTIHPSFPGWAAILTKFNHQKRRPSFKPWLRERFNVDFEKTPNVRAVVEEMKSSGLESEPELTRCVDAILRGVATGQWSPD